MNKNFSSIPSIVMNYKSDSNNDKRFQRIADKISQIQKTDIINSKSTCHETRIDNLEIDIHNKIKDFEYKSKFLTEEFEFINKLFERNLEVKEEIKRKMNFEMKILETNLKEHFEKEKEITKENLQNVLNKFETQIFLFNEEMQKEKEELNSQIFKLKDFIDLEISKINSVIEETKFEREERIEEMSRNLLDEVGYFYNLV